MTVLYPKWRTAPNASPLFLLYTGKVSLKQVDTGHGVQLYNVHGSQKHCMLIQQSRKSPERRHQQKPTWYTAQKYVLSNALRVSCLVSPCPTFTFGRRATASPQDWGNTPLHWRRRRLVTLASTSGIVNALPYFVTSRFYLYKKEKQPASWCKAILLDAAVRLLRKHSVTLSA